MLCVENKKRFSQSFLVSYTMPPRHRRRRRPVNAPPPSPEELENERIRNAFLTPGHPIAFSTPQRVSQHFNISLEKAKKLLEEIDGYTLHREYKKPSMYNPYYLHHRREQVQADLIDMGRLQTKNDGFKFLLVLIDCMTKKLWVCALRSKTGLRMKLALQRWLTSLNQKPKILKTDRGNEFTCAPVQNLLRRQGVEWQPAFGTLKACIAERVNKTLQVLIYKYLTEFETLKYIHVLDQLVNTYNNRKHRTLEGMTPNEADRPENEGRLQALFHAKYAKIATRRRPTLKFRVGDIVRVKTEPKKISSSSHAYAEQFHGEYYQVVRINRTLPIPLYYIRSTNTLDFIEGGFYGNELQRQRGDKYKIDQVINRQMRRRKPWILVRWKYFGPQWDSWIPEEDVITRFEN